VGILALAILNHIVVKPGHVCPAHHVHLFNHRLAGQRLEKGHPSWPGVDGTGFWRGLRDVVLPRPLLPFLPRQYVEVMPLDDVGRAVLGSLGVGGDVDADELVKVVLRPQRSLAGGKDLGAAAVGRVGLTG
jgi:hypothetical protein